MQGDKTHQSQLIFVKISTGWEDIYLKRNFVQLSEREDGFLHHIHTFILQQHVQIGNQPKEELVVPLTG